MTQRDKHGRFIKAAPVEPILTFRIPRTVIDFGALFAVATAWYYAAPFIVLAGVIIAPLLLLNWLEERYPRTAFILYRFLSGFIWGFFGSRYYYYRRWRRW
jgi:hypothetical protein